MSIILLTLAVGAIAFSFYLWVRGKKLETEVAVCTSSKVELGNRLSEAKREIDQLRKDVSLMQGARTAAETRLEETQRNLAEQRQLLEAAKTDLKDAFAALAAEALKSNNSQFLTLAKEKFETLKDQASSELDNRKDAVKNLVEPLSQILTTYQQETTKLKEQHLADMTNICTQLQSVASNEKTLQQETAKLVNALKTPTVRGAWGELTLRRTAELAGMSAHCDFNEQESKTTEEGRLRPDMVVKLPAGRQIVVDAKTTAHAFLRALEATSDLERESALNDHVAHVRGRIGELSAKNYWEQFQPTPEFVVAFIPNDSFLAAAAERDSDLIENALQKRVVLATPTTFIALLRAIAYGWRQELVAEHAQRISELGQQFCDRATKLVEHLNATGWALGHAVEAFNKAVGSFQERLVPTMRKFKELGVEGKADQFDLEYIEKLPRALEAKIGE